MTTTEKIVETGLNFAQIEDQVAALLHAYGVVPQNAEIVDIEFSATRPDNVVPLKVKYREEKEVSVS